MDCFVSTKMDSSTGLPVLQDQEVTRFTAKPVWFETAGGGRSGGDHVTDHKSAVTLVITTHRIVAVLPVNEGLSAKALAVKHVQTVEKVGMVRKKLQLVVRLGSGSSGGVDRTMRVEFGHKGNVDDAYQAIRAAMTEKVWEKVKIEQVVIQQKREAETRIDTSDAAQLGLAGIRRREKIEKSHREEAVSAGFADLDSLIRRAQELVEIANQLRAKTVDPREQSDVESILGGLGITSPVTLENTGGNRDLYLEQLSRQLAQFLTEPLDKLGGFITLVDAFCVFNRARATTELVSPPDFHSAVRMFPALKLSLEMRPVGASKTLAIVKRGGFFGGHESAKRLRQLAKDRGSIAPLDLVQEFHVTLQIANEQLEDAEQRQLLCRDRGDQGEMRFFPNRFPEFLKLNKTTAIL